MKLKTTISALLLLSISIHVYGDGLPLPVLIRKAVQARIELYKKTQNKKHLNSPLTLTELGRKELDLSRYSYHIQNLVKMSPLAALIDSDGKHNRDLVFELLSNGVDKDQEDICCALVHNDIPIVLLLLHHELSQDNLNFGLGRHSESLHNPSIAASIFKAKKLLLSYGAQPNSRDSNGQTVLCQFIKNIINRYEAIEEDIFFNRVNICSEQSSLVTINKKCIKEYLELIKLLLEHHANPYIKNAQDKSCFDLINECKNAQRNPADAKLKLKALPTSEQTQKELDELAVLLKKSVDDRIERMTDFLHTRALKDEAGLRQTPFTIKDIAKKIAEHVYQIDMYVSRKDWKTLAKLVKK